VIVCAAMVAACGDGGDGDDRPSPTPALSPVPDPCAVTQVCALDECQPVVECVGGCEPETGTDPSGAAYRTRCSLRRGGRSPDGDGLFHRVRTFDEVRCYVDEALSAGTFRETGRCERRFVVRVNEALNEGPLGILENPSPLRCRSRVVALDGTVVDGDECE
jgi:hypothetical protein